jgi:PHD/YefM family antitoxin component YafN of YafNO toxin-antitoxin module
MEEKMIKISRKEYEGMKETIEILQNPEMMSQILESEENIKKGKVKKFNL